MTDPDRSTGAPPSHIHLGPDKHGGLPWWAWLLAALVALALIALGMRSCSRTEPATTAAVVPAAAPVVAATRVLTLPGGRTVSVVTGSAGEKLGGFLGGSGVAPATFALDKINFDTSKSELRDPDRAAIDEIATILAAYPKTQARLVGYADNRGSAPANLQLGKARAEAVKAAIVAKGVDASRLETASGGEHDPVDNNGTPGGRFENRRTELVVTRR